MEDLISRQAAIDALEEVTSGMSVCLTTDEYYGMTRMKGMAIGALIALPSAQQTTCKYWDAESDFCALYRPSAQSEIIRCKDCKHRIVNAHYSERGYISLKAMCELDTGDPFELGRCAENDEWFCADAERRTDGADN